MFPHGCSTFCWTGLTAIRYAEIVLLMEALARGEGLQILQENQTGQDLYALLTALLRHGDAKLIRAAEVNLRSLLKQARTADVPWQSRPPGHFEPPSD